jgi:hypothetical protein
VEYIVQDEVVRTLTDSDIHSIGTKIDQALTAKATGELPRDEALIAYLILVESFAYSSNDSGPSGFLLHDELLLPVLDHIIPAYADKGCLQGVSTDTLTKARAWLTLAQSYQSIVGGVINYLQKRMMAVEVKSGRIVFYPKSSWPAEMRNRWFERRWRQSHSDLGSRLTPSDAELQEVFKKMQPYVRQHFEDPEFRPPKDRWYREFCEKLSVRFLDGQFAHVGDSERWGALTVKQVKAALGPLYRWSCELLFANMPRAKVLQARGVKFPTLSSAVGRVSRTALVEAIAKSAEIGRALAEDFVSSLVRSGQGERYSVYAYPLLPLHGDCFAYLPSAVVFGNWPLAREQAVGRGVINPSAIGESRDVRYSRRLKELFAGLGFRDVASDLVIEDRTGKALTDLDLVVVDTTLNLVLVIQLKSFVTPGNIVDIKRADKDVSTALKQCKVADDNLDIVREKIEGAFNIKLAEGWVLRQLVAVESVTGAVAPSSTYPAVSIEWLEGEGVKHAKPGDLEQLWRAAIALPDAGAFLSSIRPVFEIVEDTLGAGLRFAVLGYSSS